MNSSIGIETFHLRNQTPTLTIVSPSLWRSDNLTCITVYVIPYLIQRSTQFQQNLHEGSRKNWLTYSRPNLENLDLWIFWGGGSLASSSGDLRNEICDSPWLRELATKHQSEHPWARAWWTMGQSECFLSPKTSLSLWLSSTISRPSMGRATVPSPPRGNPQEPPFEAIATGSMEVQKRDTPSFPNNCDTTNKRAVALITTRTASTQGNRACIYQPVKHTPEISQLHSHLNSLDFEA